MRRKIEKTRFCQDGSILVLVAVALVVLSILGLGMLKIAYGVRHKAIRLKNEATAMLAAEAGYEHAIYWMGQQKDMLSALQQNVDGTSGAISLPDGSCDYEIGLYTFVRSRPVYRVTSVGHSGVFNKTVDVYVIQAISGWDMGMCRVPYGSTSTYPVNFADGEIIDMPIHINNLKDSPDEKDIYITGRPQFLERVAMGESRYRDDGSDKYYGIMYLFSEEGIHFKQPESRITDEETVQLKLDRFRSSTAPEYNFSDDTGQKPEADAPVPDTSTSKPLAAVQLEFFVEGGIGKVRITNNCTVRGYRRDSDSKTWDFKIKPGTDGTISERYYIYAYHYRPEDADRKIRDMNDTYVSQVFGEVVSEPGGQIFVDGDVIIGSEDYDEMVVKGKMTIVAAKDEDGNGGNIWVADSIKVSDYDNAGNYYPRGDDGMPAEDNPNILGLIAQGVVKVIDPGISGYNTGSPNYYPGPPTTSSFKYEIEDASENKHIYVPVCQPDYPSATLGSSEYTKRHLSDPTVVEAAIVVGGGGWGAENVGRYYGTYYGGRKEKGETSESWYRQDELEVRGTIVECCRGVVGLVGTDGYLKHYYFDERVLLGILPGDIWLQGKYVAAPSGWHDYRY